jgi:AcrR family transcriptional regulator
METPDADRAAVRGDNPPSARVALSRERIVEAALEYIENEGLAGLSMRRLGATLEVEAMSLYRYVAGREVLLDGVVERIVDSMDLDADVLQEPQSGWQDFLQRLAHGIRRVALTYPKSFPLVASRPTEAPWLRPPLRSLRWVELFLAGLTREGFSDEAAVRAYRAFTSFLLGHLLLEVAMLGADLGPLDVIDEDGDASTASYPSVHRMRFSLREDHAAAEFEESLEELINRLALIRSEG